MGLFEIAKVPDRVVKQGDTEKLEFRIYGYNLNQEKITFKAVGQNGSITKGTAGNGIYANSDITITAFADNYQTITINFNVNDFKTKTGTMKYEVQHSNTTQINTLIEGNLIIKTEIIQ
jgi:hypothetical protein